MAQWHFSYQGQRYGPVDDAVAREWASKNPQGHVWREGMQGWLPIESIPELASPPSRTTPHAPATTGRTFLTTDEATWLVLRAASEGLFTDLSHIRRTFGVGYLKVPFIQNEILALRIFVADFVLYAKWGPQQFERLHDSLMLMIGKMMQDMPSELGAIRGRSLRNRLRSALDPLPDYWEAKQEDSRSKPFEHAGLLFAARCSRPMDVLFWMAGTAECVTLFRVLMDGLKDVELR